jgi:hypothetical protein
MQISSPSSMPSSKAILVAALAAKRRDIARVENKAQKQPSELRSSTPAVTV